MQAVHEYLCMCGNQKNLDPKTLKAYRIDLRQFTGYLAGRDAAFDRAAVRDYTACMNRKFKPRTVKRKLASIRAFVTWLMDEQRLAQNPFENLHLKIHEPALLPRIIPLRIVEQMLSAAHQAMQRQPAGRALCETAVMETLFATGMRVSELSGLKAREIDLKDGVIRILGKGS